MPAVRWKTRIETCDAREDGIIVLFGDNLQQRGMGGMAQEWRNHPRSIGIPTKVSPNWSKDAYFSDLAFEANCLHIDRALKRIPEGTKVILVPTGLGRGLAKLDKKAPRTYTYLIQAINKLHTV